MISAFLVRLLQKDLIALRNDLIILSGVRRIKTNRDSGDSILSILIFLVNASDFRHFRLIRTTARTASDLVTRENR